MTTHLLHFHITFGKEVGEDMYSAAASPSGRVVKIFPILFKREVTHRVMLCDVVFCLPRAVFV